MKSTVTFLFFSAILLTQEANAFSASDSGLFRQAKPSTRSNNGYTNIDLLTTTEQRRNAFSTLPNKQTSNSNTRLSVAPGAIAGVLTGGVLGGALHAIAGPDHLAALLPRCIGQRWYKAGRIGILWGMGHGISVTMLGVLGFALKSQFAKAPGARAVLNGVSHLMEFAVGLSLIVIGAMGLREAKEWGEEMESQPAHSLSSAVSPSEAKNQNRNRAVVFNGLLHGFSWDGAPSLAPALAVASWSGNLAFLSAYAAGTVAVMAVATSFIGEGTRRAGEIFNRPDLPQKLSFFTSLLAMAIGGIWCGLALM